MNMKSLTIVILLTALFANVAYSGYSEGVNLNHELARNIATHLKLGHEVNLSNGQELTINGLRYSPSILFYSWDQSPFSEKRIQAIVEAVEPFIESFEAANDCRCQNRRFMFAEYAKDYAPEKIPSFSLTFKDNDDPEVKYYFSVDIYHTEKEMLVVSVRCILPMKKTK